MDKNLEIIKYKLLEIKLLVFLKNKNIINETDFIRIKKEIENEYCIKIG